MKRLTVFLALLMGAAGQAPPQRPPRPVVLLDGYHNSESEPHYRWEGAYPGGFSEFARLLQSLGAELRTATGPLTPARLRGATCLIIVDPDTPKETAKPNYISGDETRAVRDWVRGGGLLVLLGNDPGNAEFERFNGLAREFGLEFLKRRHLDAANSGRLALPIPAQHPVFVGGGTFYAVDVAPLRVSAPKSQVLISDSGAAIMALAEYGEGRVLALGDPWVYNEYIDARDNRALASRLFGSLLLSRAAGAQVVAFDTSGVRPGPVSVKADAASVVISWPDESSRAWRAEFSLVPGRPLIASIGVSGKTILERANPVYRCATGKRRGGWDEFFDLPPSHRDGTRAFWGAFRLRSGWARSVGDRVEVQFDGLQMGIFQGGIRYTFYPGSRLLHQEAVVTTYEPDTAYYYDAGLRFAADPDRRPGGNMESEITYYDTSGGLRTARSTGPELTPVAVRYRALAARMAQGALVVFPTPHQYFFARDFTTNMAYLWHSSWRGNFSLGIRQLPDDYTSFYPWMNAPPGTEQRLAVFYLLADQPPAPALEDVLRFTNRDRFPALAGYKTMSIHWHFAYTVQAMEKGFDWTPPFKPVLKDMGVDATVLMDFHGDGHPRDLTELRLKELEAYFKACRVQSDPDFLLIPGEEPNVHLGGHWAVIFPKPLYWFMGRLAGAGFSTADSRYGTVYRTGDERDLLELFRRENALVYTSHPRSKGSLGYPDKYRDQDFHLDSRFFGSAWKAMNSDLSSQRLGDRALKVLDDTNNWGQRKRILGEVDVFQIDETHELYSHMNVNYVRLDKLPHFDHYGDALAPLVRGDFFVTTGEVLLPEVGIMPAGDQLAVRARVRWTFPLRFAELVWGDGAKTYSETFPLETTRAFGDSVFSWKVHARDWKWARFAVWDVAANGAFVNPVWREP